MERKQQNITGSTKESSYSTNYHPKGGAVHQDCTARTRDHNKEKHSTDENRISIGNTEGRLSERGQRVEWKEIMDKAK